MVCALKSLDVYANYVRAVAACHAYWFKDLTPVVQTLDSANQRINHYPADNAIVSRNTYPLDSDLFGG